MTVTHRLLFASFAAPVASLGALWVEQKLVRWSADRQPGTTTHLTREHQQPRARWYKRVQESGLHFAELPGVHWGWPCLTTILDHGDLRSMGFSDNYWNEAACYRVSDKGMWSVEAAAFELHSLVLEAVDEVVRSEVLLEEFAIPQELWPAVRRSWAARQGDLLGRFDLLWDGEGPPKLAEYNADTPTVLVESAQAQRDWLEQVHPTKGQFNVLDEALVEGWRGVARELLQSPPPRGREGSEAPEGLALCIASPGIPKTTKVYRGGWDEDTVSGDLSEFLQPGAEHPCQQWGEAMRRPSVNPDRRAEDDSIARRFPEEGNTAMYLATRAAEAAYLTHLTAEGDPPLRVQLRSIKTLHAEQLSGASSEWSLAPGVPPGVVWKLYPWEWLIHEQVGEAFSPPSNGGANEAIVDPPPGWEPGDARHRALEPAWKLVASSKAMLAYLWRRHPGHPNLLPAHLADELLSEGAAEAEGGAEWVAKPLLGREGHGLLYSADEEHRKQPAPRAGAPPGASSSLASSASSSSSSDLRSFAAHSAAQPPSVQLSMSGEGEELTWAGHVRRAGAAARSALEDAARPLCGGAPPPPLDGGGAGTQGLMDRGGAHGGDDQANGRLQVEVGPMVVQQFHPVADLHARKVVTSAWVVRGLPAAACFREDTARTTNNNSCFVPHYVEPARGSGPPPPRPYPLTPNQARLRQELYGAEAPRYGSAAYHNTFEGQPAAEGEKDHPLRRQRYTAPVWRSYHAKKGSTDNQEMKNAEDGDTEDKTATGHGGGAGAGGRYYGPGGGAGGGAAGDGAGPRRGGEGRAGGAEGARARAQGDARAAREAQQQASSREKSGVAEARRREAQRRATREAERRAKDPEFIKNNRRAPTGSHGEATQWGMSG